MLFAEEMLTKHQEFYPFGAIMDRSGQMGHVGGWTGDEHPPSSDIIDLLRRSFRREAQQEECVATALVYDILTIPPGKDIKQDAIAVELDHHDDHSVIVAFPYSFDQEGELVLEEPFATKGEGRVFSP